MKIRMTGLSLVGSLILASSGCSILPKPQPSAVHDLGYLDSNIPTENTTLAQQSQVTVEAPKWLSDNRIRYRMLHSTPTQIRFYSLDRWIAPPPELFEQLLNTSGKQWPHPVTIQLDVFEQQFDTANKAKVIMAFTATTTPANVKDKAAKRDFHLRFPCPTPDAKGAVNGFTSLTRQAVVKVQAWLMEAK